MAMNDPISWTAFITGGLALFGTIFLAMLSYFGRKELAQLKADLQTERDERLEKWETKKLMSKFRGPLLHAAYDLQSRIYNILRKRFLQRFYSDGTEQEKDYAVENTVFLFAQFLGWTELIRYEISFLDLGSIEETQKLRDLQEHLTSRFRTDQDGFGKGFRLFAGEQRAVGEFMIERTAERNFCIGFAAFLKDRNSNLDRWLNPLREDVKMMASNRQPFERRLVEIQHGLINLLEFLDPEYLYFPKSNREEV